MTRQSRLAVHVLEDTIPGTLISPGERLALLIAAQLIRKAPRKDFEAAAKRACRGDKSISQMWKQWNMPD